MIIDTLDPTRNSTWTKLSCRDDILAELVEKYYFYIQLRKGLKEKNFHWGGGGGGAQRGLILHQIKEKRKKTLGTASKKNNAASQHPLCKKTKQNMV